MKTLSIKYILVFLLAGAVFFVHTATKFPKKNTGGEKVLLRINLEEGKTYSTVTKMKMTTEGQGMSIEMDMGFGVDLKVVEKASNGDHTLNMSYKSVRVSQDGMGQKTVYNSANAEENEGMFSMLEGIFGNMLNKPIPMKIDNRGGTVEAPDFSKAFGESYNQMQGAGNLDQSLENMFVKLPEEAVSVNDSWEKRTEINNNGIGIENFMKFTVKEIKEDKVVLNISGDLKIKEDEGNSSMIENMSGKQYGTVVVDKKTGLGRALSLTQEMDISAGGNTMQVNTEIMMETK